MGIECKQYIPTINKDIYLTWLRREYIYQKEIINRNLDIYVFSPFTESSISHHPWNDVSSKRSSMLSHRSEVHRILRLELNHTCTECFLSHKTLQMIWFNGVDTSLKPKDSLRNVQQVIRMNN